MSILSISFKLFLLVVLTIIETQADSSACEQKEKHRTVLELVKEMISKAKNLQPDCVKDSKDISSNSSECGAKERVSAYLDIAKNLLDDAKEDFSTCDKAGDIPKVVHLPKKPIDCSEILENGEVKSGEYVIWPRNRILNDLQIKVYCDMDTDGGGWTVIQRRGNFSNKVDFFRNWNDYKHGFGNISEEFWLGNDNIYALTNLRNYTVRFDMENVDKEYRFATYSPFWIESEEAGYKVHFDKYFGTAGDGIKTVKNKKFSTKDRENNGSNVKCAAARMGGWWYNYCGDSNPNGIYLPGGKKDKKYMNWHPWTVYDSLLTMEIKIRSQN